MRAQTLLLAAGLFRAALLVVVLVLAAVSYALRRHAIGGWLLFFCSQICTNVVAVSQLGLERWTALMVARFAPLGTGAVTATAATLLLIQQRWDGVVRLRYVLMAHACSLVLTALVDLKYFPVALPERLGALLMCFVWIRYFYVSDRVQSVFLARDWAPSRF